MRKYDPCTAPAQLPPVMAKVPTSSRGAEGAPATGGSADRCEQQPQQPHSTGDSAEPMHQAPLTLASWCTTPMATHSPPSPSTRIHEHTRTIRSLSKDPCMADILDELAATRSGAMSRPLPGSGLSAYPPPDRWDDHEEHDPVLWRQGQSFLISSHLEAGHSSTRTPNASSRAACGARRSSALRPPAVQHGPDRRRRTSAGGVVRPRPTHRPGGQSVSRRLLLVSAAVMGLGLVAAPVAIFQMFSRAPKGGDMIDDFRPYMTTRRSTSSRATSPRSTPPRPSSRPSCPVLDGRADGTAEEFTSIARFDDAGPGSKPTWRRHAHEDGSDRAELRGGRRAPAVPALPVVLRRARPAGRRGRRRRAGRERRGRSPVVAVALAALGVGVVPRPRSSRCSPGRPRAPR